MVCNDVFLKRLLSDFQRCNETHEAVRSDEFTVQSAVETASRNH